MKPLSLTALAAMAVAMASFALPATVMAQGNGPMPVLSHGATLLTISAEGQVTREPDLARFSAGVTSSGKTAGEALSANATDMNRVIAALKKAGIADRDIQTRNLSLSPIYAPQKRAANGQLEPQEAVIIGYRANNSVNVRQRKLNDYGRVIDALVSAGANQVNGPNFEVEQASAALDEARAAAMKTARERANLYARSAGLRVVRILAINESGAYMPRPSVMFARAASADMAAAPSPVEPGEMQLGANVTVQFELAP